MRPESRLLLQYYLLQQTVSYVEANRNGWWAMFPLPRSSPPASPLFPARVLDLPQ